MEATKGNGLTRRAFPRRGKGRGREGRMRSRRQQRGRGPLGTIGSPVNQGINMLDTSPPRGNAFVTPGNIFLPLASSPRPLSLFLLCSLYPSPRAPPPPPYGEIQPSFRSSPPLSFGLVLPHEDGRCAAVPMRWRI